MNDQTSDQVMPADKAPEKARELLNDADPGPWEVDYDGAWEPAIWSPDGIVFGPYHDREDMEQWEAGSDANLRLAAAAPTLAALVASMREEWGVEWDDDPDNPPDWGFATRAAAELWEKMHRHRGPKRGHIVRRYVTKQEKIT